jgi:transposase-like protein
MSKQNIGNIGASEESRVCFEQLEDWVRGKIQGWVQELLEEEVTELLGRGKSERRSQVDAPAGYRNGYGKQRRLTLSSGDFELALRGLLGQEAPLSASTVARLKEKWQAEWQQWQSRSLDDLEVVYLWADGVYVKAGLEKDKAVMLVLLAALSDGSKTVVSVSTGYRESTESWSGVLRDLKARGMNCPRLVIADGHLGIWGALSNVYPEAEEQRCWNHRVPRKAQTRRLRCTFTEKTSDSVSLGQMAAA